VNVAVFGPSVDVSSSGAVRRDRANVRDVGDLRFVVAD